MQDIIPPRKSIRDIPLPEGRKPILTENPPVPSPRKNSPIPPSYTPPARPDNMFTNDRKPSKLKWVIGGAVILGILLAFFLLYSKATLAIVTKNQNIAVDINATSTKDGSNGTIQYSIIKLDKSDSVELSGTVSDTQQVEKKASGTITIYNNYSAASQDLVATTRFQTSDGLVYRIDKDISIPGQTTSNGQTVPGSIDAVVYADQAGPKYNVGLTNFTIPGFQGSSKAKGFYAKSKTSMSGGYVGKATTVSDDEMTAKTQALKDSIQKNLIAQAQSQTPDAYIFFPSGLTMNFTTTIDSSSGKTMLNATGVAIAAIFNKSILTDKINQQNSTNFEVFEGWENLSADIGNAQGLTSGDFPDINLHLTGNLSVGQDINVGELQRTLAGKPKGDVTSILSAYPSVVSAKATVKPFWKTSFPKDGSKIHITLTKEND